MKPEAGLEEGRIPAIYYDRHFDMDAVKILPGEYYAGSKEMVLVTVLGSCVSACIRDKKSGIGGMNHFMLPHIRDSTSRNPLSLSARYGSYAMEVLINSLIKIGAKRENLEAKVFGGGNVLRGFTVTNVGEKNAEFVLQYLKNENISICAQDLLDIYPRKVYFFPNSGRVLVKKLKSVHNNTIIDRERLYESWLDYGNIDGEIEIFNFHDDKRPNS